MRRVLISGAIAGLFLFSLPVRGQSIPTSQPVSRQEFEELKKDNAELKKDLADVKKEQADQAANADQDAQDNDKRLKDIQAQVDKNRGGLESFVLAGDAEVGFVAQHGTHSTFDADVSPLIIWQPPLKQLLVEAAFDLQIGPATNLASEGTTLAVNLGDISYNLCDYVTIGGGLFAVPFGQFHNHFDPPWINKFPDDPLAFDAIAPISEVGVYAKGAIPSGTTMWTYDIYVTNGPNLDTSTGQLNFNDYTDLNNNKAAGGRIGFLPLPDMEMGYSVQYSEPNPDGFAKVRALLQAADFHYKPLCRELEGTFDISAEWIWADLGKGTYPIATPNSLTSTFNNYSQGGYVSVGFRPTELSNKILRNAEILARFDSLQTPINLPSNTLGGDHEFRWTVGLDYWVTSYCVVKAAYELDHKRLGEDQNAFILQLGYGL